MTTDSRSLSGRRGNVAQVAGLRPPSEGAGLEVRLVHVATLERASPCVERGHPTGARHSARGELIRLIADKPTVRSPPSFFFSIRGSTKCTPPAAIDPRTVQRDCVSSENYRVNAKACRKGGILMPRTIDRRSSYERSTGGRGGVQILLANSESLKTKKDFE